MTEPSFRAELLTRRTYCRPLPSGKYETWDDVCDRVIRHQRWLWERALGRALNEEENFELADLRALMLARVALPSGRILWMGGTAQAKKTEIAMFNCAFCEVRDVYSAVDAFYLLLNGCGVGFKPVSGLLNGFAKEVEIKVLPSLQLHEKGSPENTELSYSRPNGRKVWELIVGDSGVAWAKALGKILAMKRPVDEIVLNFSRIRKAGQPLKGYGWLSSGDAQISEAFVKICEILNTRADELLSEIDILDIINLAGTTLTSRRSAEIALLDAEHPMAEEFSHAKHEHYKYAPWRSQSNNSLVFHSRPSKLALRGFFAQVLEDGGSEPGLVNGKNARGRAPWFAGTNPCGEILLPDGGLCNLVDVDLGKLAGKSALYAEHVFATIARANYRQTTVTLKDGVLSDRWHETNEFLRLCGVGVTGVVKWEAAINTYTMADMRHWARKYACKMADELGLPAPKAVTTIKPSGTLGKIMDTTEGIHKPLGRYIFNWVKFDINDPLVPNLAVAGYSTKPDPYAPNNVLVCLPVDNGDLIWDEVNGVKVNRESAVTQLNRYLRWMVHYVDHNASVTISYDPSEVGEIVDWLYHNWDEYVGVSFILRTDPTKTAADLGYPYLPQEVVSKDTYDEYVAGLLPVDIDGGAMLASDECAGGACPVR